jgi:undecaprenyl-diphosphatase
LLSFSFLRVEVVVGESNLFDRSLLLARVQPNRALKAYLIFLAALLTIIVGLSRVYLGVHWPTDVLAGWTMGGIWALICWLVALWLQRRGRIEPED